MWNQFRWRMDEVGESLKCVIPQVSVGMYLGSVGQDMVEREKVVCEEHGCPELTLSDLSVVTADQSIALQFSPNLPFSNCRSPIYLPSKKVLRFRYKMNPKAPFGPQMVVLLRSNEIIQRG